LGRIFFVSAQQTERGWRMMLDKKAQNQVLSSLLLVHIKK